MHSKGQCHTLLRIKKETLWVRDKYLVNMQGIENLLNKSACFFVNVLRYKCLDKVWITAGSWNMWRHVNLHSLCCYVMYISIHLRSAFTIHFLRAVFASASSPVNNSIMHNANNQYHIIFQGFLLIYYTYSHYQDITFIIYWPPSIKNESLSKKTWM